MAGVIRNMAAIGALEASGGGGGGGGVGLTITDCPKNEFAEPYITLNDVLSAMGNGILVLRSDSFPMPGYDHEYADVMMFTHVVWNGVDNRYEISMNFSDTPLYYAENLTDYIDFI